MTSNQIAYAQHLETGRHNRVTEEQNQKDVESRALTAAASYWQAQTAESRAREEGRHNLATEELEGSKLSESQRHNRETERVNWYTAQSTADWQAAQSSAVQRQATAAEVQAQAATLRAANDSVRLDIERVNSESQRISALASSLQASVARGVAATREYEAETSRLSQQESARHNVANENIAWANLAENQRSAMANEYVARARAAEETRSNVVREQQNKSALQETIRHNMTNEGIAVGETAVKRRNLELTEAQQRFDRNIKSINTGVDVLSKASALATSILGGLP